MEKQEPTRKMKEKVFSKLNTSKVLRTLPQHKIDHSYPFLIIFYSVHNSCSSGLKQLSRSVVKHGLLYSISQLLLVLCFVSVFTSLFIFRHELKASF